MSSARKSNYTPRALFSFLFLSAFSMFGQLSHHNPSLFLPFADLLRLGSSLAILQGGVISFDFGTVYEILHPDADFLHLD